MNDLHGNEATEHVPTALLIIDVQQGLFQQKTPIYRAEELLDNITALVGRAHSVGALVTYVQHSNEGSLLSGSANWELHPRLRPAEDDLRIHKLHGSAFQGTPLGAELQARGIQRVVICGLVTHGCVRATALDALHLGYRVVVAGDSHSSYAKDAAQRIDEWNEKWIAAGAQVRAAAEIHF